MLRKGWKMKCRGPSSGRVPKRLYGPGAALSLKPSGKPPSGSGTVSSGPSKRGLEVGPVGGGMIGGPLWASSPVPALKDSWWMAFPLVWSAWDRATD